MADGFETSTAVGLAQAPTFAAIRPLPVEVWANIAHLSHGWLYLIAVSRTVKEGIDLAKADVLAAEEDFWSQTWTEEEVEEISSITDE